MCSATWKNHVTDVTDALIWLVGTEDPFVTPSDHLERIVKVEQSQSQATKAARGCHAHAVIDNQPASGV